MKVVAPVGLNGRPAIIGSVPIGPCRLLELSPDLRPAKTIYFGFRRGDWKRRPSLPSPASSASGTAETRGESS